MVPTDSDALEWEMVIWMNESKGPSKIVRVPLTGVLALEAIEFSFIQARPDPSPELVISASGVVVADLDLKAKTISVLQRAPNDGQTGKIAVGDFNQDGLHDFAVSAGPATHVFLATPEQP